MNIYAIIEGDVIITSPTEQEGYESFTVTSVEQLFISDPIMMNNLDGAVTTSPSIQITHYAIYKERVLAQIKSVYNYLIDNPKYIKGTKANELLEAARSNAIERIVYLRPPVTTQLEEDAYLFGLAITDKLAEIKVAKKATQNANTVSPINGKDYTFFGGVDNITKYSNGMNLSLVLNKTSREILTVEGLVQITKADLDIAILKMSIIIDDAWYKELGLIKEVMNADNIDIVKATTW